MERRLAKDFYDGEKEKRNEIRAKHKQNNDKVREQMREEPRTFAKTGIAIIK